MFSNLLFSIVANHIVENMGRMITCLSESNVGHALLQPVWNVISNGELTFSTTEPTDKSNERFWWLRLICV